MSEDTLVESNPGKAFSEGRDPKGIRDKDAGAPAEPKVKIRRRKKVSYLTANKIAEVDYKDIAILRRFVNDRGKIVPSRQSGNTAKQQRMVTRAIKRAREMALLPFVGTETPYQPTGKPRYSEQRQSHHAPEPKTEALAAEAPAKE